MADDTAPDAGAIDEGRTNSESPNSTAGGSDQPSPNEEGKETVPAPEDRIERLETENSALRDRLAEIEAELAEIKADSGQGSSGDRYDEQAGEDGTDDGRLEEFSGSADTAPLVTSGGVTYKVIGELDVDGGVGVYGYNKADSGTTYGVYGEVDSSNGYGLYTPNDVSIGGTAFVGTVSATSVNTPLMLEADGDAIGFISSRGSNGGAGNVTFGQANNYTKSLLENPVGTTISGGGKKNYSVSKPNVVYDDYGTVSGGLDNRVGQDDEDESSSRAATVSGGEGNEATDKYATVSGGKDNAAAGKYSLAAGRKASADHDGSVVIGDSTTNSVSSERQDEVRFQQEVSKEKVGAKMTLSNKQTITANRTEDIKFDKKRFDDFGWIDLSNNKFSVQGPATILLGANPTFNEIGNSQDYFFRIGGDGVGICLDYYDTDSDNTDFHANNESHYMNMLTRVPAGTTADFKVQVILGPLTDRDLDPGRGVNEFWVIKQG
jgi:hypothetical protein